MMEASAQFLAEYWYVAVVVFLATAGGMWKFFDRLHGLRHEAIAAQNDRVLPEVDGAAQGAPGRVRVYLVDPVGPSSLFFDRFFARFLRIAATRPELDVIVDADPRHPFASAASYLAVAPEESTVMLMRQEPPRRDADAPTGTDARFTAGLVSALKAHPDKRMLFVDREPPRDLAELPNTSFVGINNRRVGLLAGWALVRALTGLGDERIYVVIDGPGGPTRAEACAKAASWLDPEAKVVTVRVSDLDRGDTEDRIHRVQQDLISTHPDGAFGVFTANDETATTVCHFCTSNRVQRVRVVGCDATREMRQWVRHTEIAAATIWNRLHQQEQVDTVVRALNARVFEAFDPVLYPTKAHEAFLRDRLPEEFRQEWERAGV